MAKTCVWVSRLVGLVEPVNFGVDGVIDTIDEIIIPIDEKFTSKKVLRKRLANIVAPTGTTGKLGDPKSG